MYFIKLFLKLCFVILICLLVFYPVESANSTILSGSVNEERVLNETGVVIDNRTGNPIVGASVAIPSVGIKTHTDSYGNFSLRIPNKTPLIMSVKAKGYAPFSAIIDKNDKKSPLAILIEKTKNNELVIDTELHHLGDNKFSDSSANAGEFSIVADGSTFFKEFFIKKPKLKKSVILKIGSIIGIDTSTAQSMLQSHVLTASSSPVQIFFNSRKVGEIKYNGNEHCIDIPAELIRYSSYNHIRIKTGENLNSVNSKDYDDIEFMNLVLEFN